LRAIQCSEELKKLLSIFWNYVNWQTNYSAKCKETINDNYSRNNAKINPNISPDILISQYNNVLSKLIN